MLTDEIVDYHLQDVYGVTYRWLGKDAFCRLVSLFVQDLPKHFNLEVGREEFPQFLRTEGLVERFPFIVDVALLELYCYNASSKKSAKTSLQNWMSFSPDEIPLLCFQPQPSLKLFSAPYDLKKVFTTQKVRRGLIPEILRKSSWAFVIQVKGAVEVHWLRALEYLFLESLSEGASLKDSCQRVFSIDPHFDIASSLQLFFSCSVFQSVYTDFSCGMVSQFLVKVG